MSPSVLEMTKDLVIAQIRTDNMSPEEMQEALRRTHQSLQTLKSREESGFPAPVAAPAPIDWHTSITRHAITCLECGAKFKQLKGRHLREHGLNARSYRTKYGIPHSQPLAARATTAKRRQIVSEVKPWEQSPTYMKGQEQKAAIAKKAGRKKGVLKR